MITDKFKDLIKNDRLEEALFINDYNYYKDKWMEFVPQIRAMYPNVMYTLEDEFNNLCCTSLCCAESCYSVSPACCCGCVGLLACVGATNGACLDCCD